MFFLIANIIFATSFALILKWIENREWEDVVTIGMLNYIVAAFISIVELAFPNEIHWTTNAIATGVTNGVCYFIAFFFCIYAIRYIGVANSTVVSILSILVPILCGIYIWSENPGPYQVAGVVLGLLSLSLIGRKGDAINKGQVADKPWFTPWIIIAFFILCALSRLSQEAFKHMCDEQTERPVYLISAFVVAAVPSVAVLLYRMKPIKSSEWILGVGLGASNMLQAHFILKSLSYYPGYIVFPVVSAGGLMLVTLVATRLMGEKLSRLSYIGIALACISLVLLKGFE